MAKAVDILLHRVTDKDQRVDPLLLGLGEGMIEYPGDLRLSADAEYRPHRAVQVGGGAKPAACLAFVEAAIEGELDVQAAKRGGRFEHFALDLTGAVPARFAA